MTPANPDALADALARAEKAEATVAEHADYIIDLEFKVAAAEARAAQLQAEVEALREALKPFAEYARLSDEAGLNIGPGEIGEFIHGGLRRSIHTRDLEAARTALAARAATAREGA